MERAPMGRLAWLRIGEESAGEWVGAVVVSMSRANVESYPPYVSTSNELAAA